MVVDIADEEDADGAFLLRGQRLAPRCGGSDVTTPSNALFGIAFAGFVIEDSAILPCTASL
jgi:hypothetical protein